MKGEDWAVLAAWSFIAFFVLYMIAQVVRVII